MKISVAPGKYILAVSGGVDSMVLLDLLSNLPGVDLVVAHFNHGIRPDGGEDETLAASVAAAMGLPFEAARGELGAGASEETARRARYEFLNATRTKHGAGAIITAHHQDDLIETAIINLLRGTGRRGLSAISNNKNVLRPLLNHSKKEIISYADENKLRWRDDPTNDNQDYLRNYVRHNLVSKMTAEQRRNFLEHMENVTKHGAKIDHELPRLSLLLGRSGSIDRSKFSALPAELGDEILVHWLRQNGLLDFDKRTVNRLNVALRTAKSNSKHHVKEDLSLRIGRKTARFERRPLR